MKDNKSFLVQGEERTVMTKWKHVFVLIKNNSDFRFPFAFDEIWVLALEFNYFAVIRLTSKNFLSICFSLRISILLKCANFVNQIKMRGFLAS